MTHPIPVSQTRVDINFLAHTGTGKAHCNTLTRIFQTSFNHYSQTPFAQSRSVTMHQDWISGMAGFDKNDREVDLHTPKRPQGIELRLFSRSARIHWASQVPVVIDVLRLAHEFILDRSFTGAAYWEFLSADYDGLMRWTMTA